MRPRLIVSDAAWTVALLALCTQALVYVVRVASVLTYPFDLDQGEGYDVFSGLQVLAGQSIYTDNETFPFYSSNYPPLYAVVTAGAIALVGPDMAAGRWVSFTASVGVGALVFLAASRRSNTMGGLIATGFYLLSNYVFHVAPLARVNALTALFALGGVLAIASGGRWRIVAGLILLLAAMFTKPTAIDATIAGLLALLLTDRRIGLLATAGTIASGAILVAALEITTAGAFSLNVVRGNVNPFLPGQLMDYLANFGVLHAVALMVSLAVTLRAFRRGKLDALHLLLATGLVAGLGVGKWGAGESYFLTAIVASAILAGACCGRLAARGGWASFGVALAVIVQCGVSAHGLISSMIPWLPDRGLQASALAASPTVADLERGYRIATRLRIEPGEALVEDPGFSIAAGRQVVGNATHLRNLHEAGLWRPEAFVADLAARRYHTVVLDAELYPEPALVAIGRYYFLYDTVDVYGARQKVFLPGTR